MSASVARVEAAADRFWAAMRSSAWRPYSRLFLVGDGAAWSLTEDMRALRWVAGRIGVRFASHRRPLLVRRQSVFHSSQFALMDAATFDGDHRIGVAYFHGKPSPAEAGFSACFAALTKSHERISRVQVSNASMRDVVLHSGIDSTKVFQIPIGIDVGLFPLRSPHMREAARASLGVPMSAIVVGSFQKDGVGWGDGQEPKLIKGPDVLLETLSRLRARVPALYVLLSGPARGYVKAGLERMSIPYQHELVATHAGMARLYQALDLYLVSSRDEGGPKAVLESMASGVPLVSTRVGQAVDLVSHGQNGWLAEVGDVEALAELAYQALAGPHQPNLLTCARQTAEQHTYTTQLPRWREFFSGFVDNT